TKLRGPVGSGKAREGTVRSASKPRRFPCARGRRDFPTRSVRSSVTTLRSGPTTRRSGSPGARAVCIRLMERSGIRRSSARRASERTSVLRCLSNNILIREPPLDFRIVIRIAVYLDVGVDQEIDGLSLLRGLKRQVAASGEGDAVFGQVAE